MYSILIAIPWNCSYANSIQSHWAYGFQLSSLFRSTNGINCWLPVQISNRRYMVLSIYCGHSTAINSQKNTHLAFKGPLWVQNGAQFYICVAVFYGIFLQLRCRFLWNIMFHWTEIYRVHRMDNSVFISDGMTYNLRYNRELSSKLVVHRKHPLLTIVIKPSIWCFYIGHKWQMNDDNQRYWKYRYVQSISLISDTTLY